MDEFTLTLIAALLNGISLAIGMIIGTRLTGSTLLKTFEVLAKKSPTAQRLLKILDRVDKLLEAGELDKLIKNVTTFFAEASELVSRPEAKNFFKNLTELMKELGVEPEKAEIKLPSKTIVKPETGK